MLLLHYSSTRFTFFSYATFFTSCKFYTLRIYTSVFSFFVKRIHILRMKDSSACFAEDNWTDVMYDAMRATSPWACWYFIALLLVGRYTIFNLFVAILLSNFSKSRYEEDEVKRHSVAEKVVNKVRKPLIDVSLYLRNHFFFVSSQV